MHKGIIYLSISLALLLISITSEVTILGKFAGILDPSMDESLIWYPMAFSFGSVFFGIIAKSNYARSDYGCFINALIVPALVNLLIGSLFTCYLVTLYYWLD